MYVRRSELVFCLLVVSACGSQPDQALLAVEQGRAREAALEGSPTVSATLLLTAVTVEACVGQAGLWDDVEVGDPAPLSDGLSALLGDPTVSELTRTVAHTVAMVLDGVSLWGQAGALLSLDAQGDGSAMQMDILAEVDSATFASLTLQVANGCADVPRVTGTSEWDHDDGSQETVKFPVGETPLFFEGEVPWLPTSGDLVWTGQVRTTANSLSTDDAATMSVDSAGDLPVASWPATVTYQDRSVEADLPIAF
jgi:hypothetical protein